MGITFRAAHRAGHMLSAASADQQATRRAPFRRGRWLTFRRYSCCCLQVSADDSARIKELEGVVSKFAAQLAELQASAAELQRKVVLLQAQIDNAGGEKLRSQKRLVAKLSKDIESLEAGVTKKGVQVKANQKQLDKLQKETGKQVRPARTSPSGMLQ